MPVLEELDIQEELRTFTVREVFEALKKNGFEHLREQWVAFDGDGKPVGACVLGQAGLNLGIELDDDATFEGNLFEELNKFEAPEKWVKRAEFRIEEELNNKAGRVIVALNDKLVSTEDKNGNLVYELPTYADVVEMAREVLEPHFDKTVTLPVEY